MYFCGEEGWFPLPEVGEIYMSTLELSACTDATPIREITEQYNRLAIMIEAPVVKKFENRTKALRRLEQLKVEVQARFVTAQPSRKKRQKEFNYPPRDELKALIPNSLRKEAFDLLQRGATLGRVEQLVADWDRRRGKTPNRIEPRAYGLVRLLHSYIGYALRQEGEGDNKVIYVMTPEEWKAWKKQPKAA